jgi:cation diffusion facilitator family transporter
MANEQERAPGSEAARRGGAGARSHDMLGPLSRIGPGKTSTAGTVLVALGTNLLVATAKSVAAALTGSASVLAEAAHSWADTGNEVFLMIANRRSVLPPDCAHPFGHGREAYVWSLFAALGLFVSGAVVSLLRGIHELVTPEPASRFTVGYVVLAVSFVLEATSLWRAARQAGREARSLRRDVIEHVLATSDPVLRAVFAEDAAALIGLVVATAGLAAHQLTGSVVPDAVGSILVGLLLAIVAVVLIDRNRRFLVGQEAGSQVRGAVIRALLDDPDVSRLTYLRVEFVGPRMISIVGDVDLVGDDPESHVAVRLRALESRIKASPAVAGVLLSLSAPDEPTLPD